MQYRQYLRQHAFSFQDYVKDFAKTRLTNMLPRQSYSGRTLYYHYVFPENYHNFKLQINLLNQIGFQELAGKSEDKFSITFDDTYRLNKSVITYLRKKGIPVTLFVSPNAIETGLDIYSKSKLPQFTLDDLKCLMDLGVSLQNHTYFHQEHDDDLNLLSDFERAQEWFDKRLSLTPKFAALPRGDMPKNLAEFAKHMKSLDIEGIFTTSRYTETNKFFYGRHHIMPHWPRHTLQYFFNV